MEVVPTAELLFAAHRDGVFRYLCRMVGHAEAARDLTQEVFLRVTQTPAPDTDEGGRAWVFAIARNLALNHVRDRRRRQEVPPVQDVSRGATQEVALSVNQALAELDSSDCDLFLLRELGGLSYDEIAVASGLSADAVRNRLHRTRVQLRESLRAPIAEQRGRGIRNR